MKVSGIDCPSCGAPILLKEGTSSGNCEYCGKKIVIESKMLEDVGEKISSKLHEVDAKTQSEIQRLQRTQELSMLQMQLSSLRAEKRNLERNPNRQAKAQLAQIEEEEKEILNRISRPQGAPNRADSSANEQDYQFYDPQVSNRSKSTALLLAIFFGMFGVHRFYTGHIGSGVLQFLTSGGFVVWWIIDIIAIATGDFRDSKGKLLNKAPLNPQLKQILVFFFLGIIIMAVIMSFTGVTESSEAHPALMPISFALSALILNAKKIFALIKSAKGKWIKAE